MASDRRIILLTAFRKQRMREETEVQRARRAMRRCDLESHTAEGGKGSWAFGGRGARNGPR
jgi:hypothetical protein